MKSFISTALGLGLLAFSLAPSYAVPAPPYITAEPQNVIISKDQTKGTALIEWDAGNERDAELWLKVSNDNETKVSGNEKGEVAAIIALDKTYLYKLYKNAKRDNVLKSITVTASRPRPNTAPGGSVGGETKAAPPIRPGEASLGVKIGEAGRIKPGMGIKITPETSMRSALMLRNVRVQADTTNVTFSFETSQKSPTLIEIGRQPATQDRHGVWTLPYGSSLATRFVTPDKGNVSLNLNASNEQLEMGTTYYYILNVFNDNKNDTKLPRVQQTGQFTTAAQHVKVVYEYVHVINDSDPNGGGEIMFSLWANPGDPTVQSAKTGELVLLDSNVHSVAETLSLTNVPNELKLAVYAEDEDTLGNEFREDGATLPKGGPGSDDDYEWNEAKESFDLTKYNSGDKVPFKLQSMPHPAGDDSDLDFEVSGYFIVTRIDAPSSTEPAPSPAPPPAAPNPQAKIRPREKIRIIE